ncbi:nucleotidyltransferase/DNA polymerase involved in DNA repair [Methanohalophilus levihalophilus]|uniref:helix-hairpin-helix domain-containing protein n=1 Tax=Methanohalophilus levihalophilus TaxID=1431282 RepID=UPI001AEA3CFF|nr:helix-hairpin-helix domain-containing protein [Methanohalophilus levihalophilus]MBP2030027.1 nucleotidyltransferase/DNA polymerase involved in DNA repair [Methanohalophilus levihalophilus]
MKKQGRISEKEKALDELTQIPGFGVKSATNLWDLGIHSIADLKGKDPELLYLELMDLAGHHVDRCVLYGFREAVYYASHKNHDPELLKWWNWSDANLEKRKK